jgi:hypothetical protein
MRSILQRAGIWWKPADEPSELASEPEGEHRIRECAAGIS